MSFAPISHEKGAPANELDRSGNAMETRGSFDHAQPTQQMKAIDLALRNYFGANDWLDQRLRNSG